LVRAEYTGLNRRLAVRVFRADGCRDNDVDGNRRGRGDLYDLVVGRSGFLRKLLRDIIAVKVIDVAEQGGSFFPVGGGFARLFVGRLENE